MPPHPTHVPSHYLNPPVYTEGRLFLYNNYVALLGFLHKDLALGLGLVARGRASGQG